MLSQYFRSLKQVVSTQMNSRQGRSRTNNAANLGYEPLEHRLLLAAVTPDWVFGIGGAGWDDANDVAVGSAGDVYVSGAFGGTVDFDPGPVVQNLTANPDPDIRHLFVAKYTSSGEYLWAKNLGTSQQSSIGIWNSAVDKFDNVYLSGWFDTSAQIGNETLIGPDQTKDAFVTKIAPDGTFLWTTNTNTTAYDLGRGIAVDDTPLDEADWSVYMAVEGGTRAYWKFNADTGNTMWTEPIARDQGQSQIVGTGIAVDNTGDVYLTGKFWGRVDFGNITLRETNRTSDLFAARLDPAGNVLWVKQFAGNGSSNSSSSVRGLEVGQQNVYMLGSFGRSTPTEPIDFDPSSDTYELTSAGEADGFVLALGKESGSFAWANRWGSADNDFPKDLDVYQDNIYITGPFKGIADFGGQTLTSAGGDDGFVSQIDSNGSFVQTWQIEGPTTQQGMGIAVDAMGSVYATGYFGTTAIFPNGDQLTSNGSADAFVMKFSVADPNNLPPTADAGGPYSGSEDGPVLFDASGSSDPDMDGLTYQWDFGDGSTIVDTTDPTIFHTYEWGESFVVTLTVSDGNGGSDSTTTTADVTELNDIPIADAGGSYNGTEGVSITFDASGSTDFDNQDGTTANDQSLEYTWVFGDGGSSTTSSPTTSYSYATAGSYNVTVSVNDGVASDMSLTTAMIVAPPTGNANDIYVWDIYFDQRTRGSKRDARFYIDVNRDSNADGLAADNDAAATGVIATVELLIWSGGTGTPVGTYSGTTDSNGIFRSNWIRDLAFGEYTAEVIELEHTTYNWNQLFTFDNDDDKDGDGLPDDVFTIS